MHRTTVIIEDGKLEPVEGRPEPDTPITEPTPASIERGQPFLGNLGAGRDIGWVEIGGWSIDVVGSDERVDSALELGRERVCKCNVVGQSSSVLSTPSSTETSRPMRRTPRRCNPGG